MINMIQNAKDQAAALAMAAYKAAVADGSLPEAEVKTAPVEIPKDTANGDFTTTFALAASKALRQPPRNIAQTLLDHMNLEGTYFESAEIAGPGFLNFRLGAWVYNTTRVTKVEGADPHYNADQRVFNDRWKQPGDHALYKDIADTSRPEQTDRFAEKEHTLSLGSLNLSYEFSDKLCKRMKLRNLRAGINFTDILRLSTVKIERGTDYLYSQGFEFYLNVTL